MIYGYFYIIKTYKAYSFLLNIYVDNNILYQSHKETHENK